MRLDARSDGCKALLANGGRINVYLDGKRVEKCVIADEERGLIERLDVVNGNIICDYEASEAVRITEHGRVQIEIVRPNGNRHG